MKQKRYQFIRMTAVCLMLGMGTSMAAAALIPTDACVALAKKKKIGKKKAKSIALKDAGLKASDVKNFHVSVDYEDDYDTDIYEVEFDKGRDEYSYDIHAYTGKILDKDIDYDD